MTATMMRASRSHSSDKLAAGICPILLKILPGELLKRYPHCLPKSATHLPQASSLQLNFGMGARSRPRQAPFCTFCPVPGSSTPGSEVDRVLPDTRKRRMRGYPLRQSLRFLSTTSRCALFARTTQTRASCFLQRPSVDIFRLTNFQRFQPMPVTNSFAYSPQSRAKILDSNWLTTAVADFNVASDHG
jgi:hypothetical protein